MIWFFLLNIYNNIESKKWRVFYFEKFNIDILRTKLLDNLRVTSLPFPPDSVNAINDWIALLSFLGNDFLPMLIDMKKGKGLRGIVGIWKSQLPKMGGYITTSQGNVNLVRLMMVIGEFKQPNILPTSGEAGLNQREIYYKRYLGIPHDDKEAMIEAARCYLRLFCWNFKAILNGCPDWTSYYPYLSPPYLADLKSLANENFVFVLGTPPYNIEFLVMNTRDNSKHLVPKTLRHLLPILDSPAIDKPEGKYSNPPNNLYCKLLSY